MALPSNSINIPFNKDDMTFLGLNILGHDVIHDFGDPRERWPDCRKAIDYFINNSQSGGNSLSIARKIIDKRQTNPQKHFISLLKQGLSKNEASKILNKIYSTTRRTRRRESRKIYPQTFEKFEEITYPDILFNFQIFENEENIDLYVNQIQNVILLNCLSEFITIDTDKRIFEIVDKVDLYNPNSNPLFNLCLRIFDAYNEKGKENIFFYLMGCNFYLYIISESKLNNLFNQLTYNDILFKLKTYFINDYFFYNLLDIWFPEISIDIVQIQNYVIKKDQIEITQQEDLMNVEDESTRIYQNGGTLTIEDANRIKELFTNFKNESTLLTLIETNQKIYNDFLFPNYDDINLDINENNKLEYDKNKNFLIDILVNMCKNQDMKQYNKRYFDVAFIKIMPSLRGRLKSIDMKEAFNLFIDFQLLKEVNSIIDKDADNKRKDLIRQLEEERKEAAGELTDKHKLIIDDFSSFIARMSLINNKVCDKDGNYIYNGNSFESLKDGMLKREIEILYHQSNRISQWGNIRGKAGDLDSVLLEVAMLKPDGFLGEYIVSSTSREIVPLCNKGGNKCRRYLINNAAPLSRQQALSQFVFCPVTSVIDAQSNCSWNTAKLESGFEAGNMNFKLIEDQNNNYFYQGILQPDISKQTATININFNNNEYNFTRTIETLFDKKQGKLMAANALSVMLNELYEKYFQQIKLDRGLVFSYIFNQDNYKDYLQQVYYILFKGTGDLFQEINAVAVQSGYTPNPPKYGADKRELIGQIAEVGRSANFNTRTRLFLANDRPSSVRFGFMLIKGLNNINKNAYGGYFSSTGKSVIFKRKDISQECLKCIQNQSGGVGGYKKNKTLKYKNSYYKNTSLRKYKKYKSNSKKVFKSMTRKYRSSYKGRRHNKRKNYTLKRK